MHTRSQTHLETRNEYRQRKLEEVQERHSRPDTEKRMGKMARTAWLGVGLVLSFGTGLVDAAIQGTEAVCVVRPADTSGQTLSRSAKAAELARSLEALGAYVPSGDRQQISFNLSDENHVFRVCITDQNGPMQHPVNYATGVQPIVTDLGR